MGSIPTALRQDLFIWWSATVTTADRYILREIGAPFLLGVGAFVVMLAGDVLYALASLVAARRITLEVLARLLAYKLPAILVITFPVSTLFGALLGLARLTKDQELQALRLAGLSLTRIFAPVLAFGLVAAVAAFFTNEYFAPWANRQANMLLRRAVLGDALPQIRQQVFFRGPGNRFFYIERTDRDQTLHNVMVYEPAGALPRLITARQATWGGRALRLAEGVVRELDEQGFTRYEARFARMDIAVEVDSEAFLAGERTPDEMTARELRRYLAAFGHQGAASASVMELHRKFAVPLAAVVFALLAAPLSVYTAQGGRFLGMGLTVIVLFLYYAVMSSARAMGAAGAVSPALAAWLPNLLFTAGGLAIWARQDQWGRRAPVPSRVSSVGASS
ncbi:MAG: LptF/LptG family permease [Armatimonadota bacterium]|nr:LptF/LptG family permease [Armatimonadota bacterium]